MQVVYLTGMLILCHLQSLAAPRGEFVWHLNAAIFWFIQSLNYSDEIHSHNTCSRVGSSLKMFKAEGAIPWVVGWNSKTLSRNPISWIA